MKLFVAYVVALQVGGPAAHADELLPTCEPALTDLVRMLNESKQLGGESHAYQGATPDKSYSPCILESDSTYILHRSDDNSTILVEKRVLKNQPGTLFGPFQSAYRK